MEEENKRKEQEKWEKTHLEGGDENLPKFLNTWSLEGIWENLGGFESKLGVSKGFGVDGMGYL